MTAPAAPDLKIPPVVAKLGLQLEAGGHSPDGKACIMEVVAMMAGEAWSDHPACTSPVIAAFCRTFWDKTPRTWQGLLDRVERIAGSASTPEVDRARGYLAADWAVRRFAPRWLRRAGLDDDAKALEALAPVIDEASARAARSAASGIRQRSWDRYYQALERLRSSAEAAWAAEAAGAAGAAGAAWAAWAAEAAWAAWAAWAAEAAWAAWAAWAAEAAGAAGAAGAAWAAWAAEADLKGKTYAEKKAWFTAKINEAIGDEINASIDDGFALLDAMLILGELEAQSPAGDERPAAEATS